MHKTLLAVVSAAALSVGALAAPAHAAPVRVDGDHFGKSGLTYLTQGCNDDRAQPLTQPQVLVRSGPGKTPVGTQSVGWDMQDQTTYGAGLLAHVPDPLKLKRASIKVFNTGGSGQGSAYAIYHAPNDSGVWKGLASLPIDNTSGWHRVDAEDVAFNWLHYTNGTQDRDDSAMTLSDMAARYHGNGKGARIGMLFGCRGETFYVDDFELVSKKMHRTYDLGGYRTLSDIIWGTVVRKKITITYGQRLGLTGRLRQKSDASPLSGQLRLDAKRSGAKKWSKFGHVASRGDFKVSPSRTTTYRSKFAGQGEYRASDWKPLQVRVRSVVKAGLADSTVTKGHSFTAKGRVLPKRGATLQLQRYVHKHWRTIKKGKSGKDGRFHISLVANSTGTSFWRVVATNGGGNLANHSNQMKLKVSAPRHHTSGGGGGGGGTTDPPPPPDAPPPPTEPPPPSH